MRWASALRARARGESADGLTVRAGVQALLEGLVATAGSALRRTQLFEDVKRRSKQMETLRAVTEMMSSVDDPNMVPAHGPSARERRR
jgi:hypothetical protein